MLDLPGALAAYEEALAHDFDEEGLREAAEVGLQRVRAPVDEAERERAAKEHARRQREEALRTVAELSSFSAAIDAAARARDGSDIEIYVAAATRALELADDYDKRVIALTSQGAALRRAGQLKEAIEVLEEAVLCGTASLYSPASRSAATRAV
jgi:tetratricopeptide (TPR) repeat protein